eukprot:scaffold369_cov177-Ochromonas_danica.AAC.40
MISLRDEKETVFVFVFVFVFDFDFDFVGLGTCGAQCMDHHSPMIAFKSVVDYFVQLAADGILKQREEHIALSGRWDGVTALRISAAKGDAEIVRLLLLRPVNAMDRKI